jgi:hypothetical protein
MSTEWVQYSATTARPVDRLVEQSGDVQPFFPKKTTESIDSEGR